jgi:hypothetical protein
MNFSRKTIVYGTLAVIAMMGLFPPWKIGIRSGGYEAIRTAYGFILSPPFRGFGEIYFSKLIIQWVLISIIAYGVLSYLKKKEEYSVTVHCPKCGKGVRDEDQFCSGCGNDISKVVSGTVDK